jgi:DNA repair protein RecO (recombination protein O)
MAASRGNAYLPPMDFAAIIVAVLPHGEHGAVVRALSEHDGVVAAYIPGGRSRAQRPVLQPGNGVAVRLRERASGTLPTAAVELVRARTGLATGRATAAALDYLTALVATVLDDGVAQPRLHAALDGVLDAMAFADVSVWPSGVVRFELLLLAELGFGLDLATCAATGASAADADLAYVSPKSSHAVGRAAGAPYAARLLPLPAFLVAGGAASAGDVAAGFRTTGFFLERDVLTGRAAALLPARDRMRQTVAEATVPPVAPHGG